MWLRDLPGIPTCSLVSVLWISILAKERLSELPVIAVNSKSSIKASVIFPSVTCRSIELYGGCIYSMVATTWTVCDFRWLAISLIGTQNQACPTFQWELPLLLVRVLYLSAVDYYCREDGICSGLWGGSFKLYRRLRRGRIKFCQHKDWWWVDWESLLPGVYTVVVELFKLQDKLLVLTSVHFTTILHCVW